MTNKLYYNAKTAIECGVLIVKKDNIYEIECPDNSKGVSKSSDFFEIGIFGDKKNHEIKTWFWNNVQGSRIEF